MQLNRLSRCVKINKLYKEAIEIEKEANRKKKKQRPQATIETRAWRFHFDSLSISEAHPLFFVSFYVHFN